MMFRMNMLQTFHDNKFLKCKKKTGDNIYVCKTLKY